jgi:hypothetical protein
VPECRYQPGQIWSYKDAPRSDSRAIVGRVENIAGTGWVVSVCVTNVYLPNWQTRERELNAISHAPMTAEAMDISVIEQTGTGEPIDGFVEGYGEWRSLLDKGEAGVFTITVVDVVKFIGEAVAKGR